VSDETEELSRSFSAAGSAACLQGQIG
jgi:hypothetical protein